MEGGIGGGPGREFSFPNLAAVPKVKAGNFSPAAKGGRAEGMMEAVVARAAAFKTAW